MQPKRKKIIRAKYQFLQDLESESFQPWNGKKEIEGGREVRPRKFHSNRWAERLGQ